MQLRAPGDVSVPPQTWALSHSCAHIPQGLGLHHSPATVPSLLGRGPEEDGPRGESGVHHGARTSAQGGGTPPAYAPRPPAKPALPPSILLGGRAGTMRYGNFCSSVSWKTTKSLYRRYTQDPKRCKKRGSELSRHPHTSQFPLTFPFHH